MGFVLGQIHVLWDHSLRHDLLLNLQVFFYLAHVWYYPTVTTLIILIRFYTVWTSFVIQVFLWLLVNSDQWRLSWIYLLHELRHRLCLLSIPRVKSLQLLLLYFRVVCAVFVTEPVNSVTTEHCVFSKDCLMFRYDYKFLIYTSFILKF